MPSTRRTALGLLGSCVLGSFAGCSSDGGSRPMVTVVVANDTGVEQSVKLEVVPATVESDLSENAVFERWVDLGPTGSETEREELVDAFESVKALIRVQNQAIGVVGEYTFVPDCSRDDEFDSEVRVLLKEADSVTFDQNRCYDS